MICPICVTNYTACLANISHRTKDDWNSFLPFFSKQNLDTWTPPIFTPPPAPPKGTYLRPTTPAVPFVTIYLYSTSHK